MKKRGSYMRHSKLILAGLLLVTTSIHSCSKSNFAGSNGSPSPAKKTSNSNPTTSTATEGDTESGAILGQQEMREKCWFAVSGGWLGANTKSIRPQNTDWGSVFPKTKSGKPIGHGEIFDDVGGIFLDARAEPYVSQISGTNCSMNSSAPPPGKELDQAILCTFDTIAVAPGMHAVIKSTNGTTIYESDGPFIGVSDGHPEYGGPYFSLLKTSNMLTAWMDAYIKGLTSIKQIVGLQASRSVHVTAIKGDVCDNSKP